MVEFAVYKMSRKVHKNRFSMAMHGFEEEAWIVQRSTGRYLNLTLKDRLQIQESRHSNEQAI